MIHAQDEHRQDKNSIYIDQPRRESRYDERIHRYRKHWEALIPTESVLQYAGNMGLISAGIGWDYGKHRQWETHLLVGIVPKCQSARARVSMTLKQNYIPFSRRLGNNLYIEPLETGIYFNTIFGHEFWSSMPHKYPKGYYKFATKVRPNIFVGQRLTKLLDADNRLGVRSVTIFYEVSSCDMYIFNKIKNTSISLGDILCLSLGLKFQLL